MKNCEPTLTKIFIIVDTLVSFEVVVEGGRERAREVEEREEERLTLVQN